MLVLHIDLNSLSNQRLKFYEDDLKKEFWKLAVDNFFYRALYLSNKSGVDLQLKKVLEELEKVRIIKKERGLINE